MLNASIYESELRIWAFISGIFYILLCGKRERERELHRNSFSGAQAGLPFLRNDSKSSAIAVKVIMPIRS